MDDTVAIIIGAIAIVGIIAMFFFAKNTQAAPIPVRIAYDASGNPIRIGS